MPILFVKAAFYKADIMNCEQFWSFLLNTCVPVRLPRIGKLFLGFLLERYAYAGRPFVLSRINMFGTNM